mmetsp:Transcript_1410/g.3090  ORF Transcript_1410/g.3090 Transcript_1410/m.3090 type:complete len:109 (-) Transcript_1410:57-383(-)
MSMNNQHYPYPASLQHPTDQQQRINTMSPESQDTERELELKEREDLELAMALSLSLEEQHHHAPAHERVHEQERVIPSSAITASPPIFESVSHRSGVSFIRKSTNEFC